ncbi:hypothetical protein [Porphyrobacter sp. TH134]|uniref:hypothetical protein n=1 Tax=Porphyrobacter sp. TH134 TaxID=2067450 RepID=UPI0011813215|nr:hypothetical protein [Porphyrobacter sp. TH134]
MSLVLMLGMAAAQPAQPSQPSGEESVAATNAPVARAFAADFFAAFAPRTAFDMIARLPGFTLQEGASVRGLSGGGGNVFVNGARIATKDISLEDYLRRIPAAAVLRIEIVDASTMGLDAAAFRQVANVVLQAKDESSGVATLRMLATRPEDVAALGQISWQGSLAGLRLTAGGEYGTNNISRMEGTQSLSGARANADGPLRENRVSRIAAGNVSLGGTLGPVTATASYSHRENPFRRNADFFARPGDTAQPDFLYVENYHYRDESDEFSLMADATFGRHKLKLVGLRSRVRLDTVSLASTAVPDRPLEGSSFTLAQVQDETIGRLNWSAGFTSFEPSLAVEIANNTLRADTIAVSLWPGANPSQQDTNVVERRVTVEAGAVWKASSRVNFNAVVARETSRITVTQPTSARNSYAFTRGRFVANFDPSPILTTALQFERNVGQLNFNDFVGAQQVFDGTATISNDRLRPSSTNSLAVNIDWRPRFGGGLNLRVSHNWLSNVVDTIPLGQNRQGVGNIDHATEWLIDLGLTLPLNALWRGTELAINGNWRETRVTDPFNGQKRALQGGTGRPLQVELRRAANSSTNYGITYTGTFRSYAFRREVFLDYAETDSFGFYVEQTLGKHLKLRLSGERLGGRSIDRDLFTSGGVRGVNPVVQTERRRRPDSPLFRFQIEQAF